MSHSAAGEIRSLVARVTTRPLADIAPGDRLIADLKCDGDDLTLWLIPEIKRRFGIAPRIAEWEQIVTIADLVALVDRHLAHE